MLEDGRVLDVSNVIWSTGYTPSYDWIDLPCLFITASPSTSGHWQVLPRPVLHGASLPLLAELGACGRSRAERRVHRRPYRGESVEQNTRSERLDRPFVTFPCGGRTTRRGTSWPSRDRYPISVAAATQGGAMRTLIANGTVITATDSTAADVLIEDEQVAAVVAPGSFDRGRRRPHRGCRWETGGPRRDRRPHPHGAPLRGDLRIGQLRDRHPCAAGAAPRASSTSPSRPRARADGRARGVDGQGGGELRHRL